MTFINNNGAFYNARVYDNVLQTRNDGAATWNSHPQMVTIQDAYFLNSLIYSKRLDSTYKYTQINVLSVYETATQDQYNNAVATGTEIEVAFSPGFFLNRIIALENRANTKDAEIASLQSKTRNFV